MGESTRGKFGQKEHMNNLKSITPSGFFGSGPENIIKVDNFIKPQELNFLENFAKDLDDWDSAKVEKTENGKTTYVSDYWDERVASSSTINKNNPEVIILIETLNSRLKKIIKDRYKVDAEPVGPAIARWLPGNYQFPHADKEIHDGPDKGKPNNFPFYDIGAIYYLNNDYVGGEIYFPNQDIEFKPRAGAACFFPGDLHYIHGVREIKSGIRYTSPAFWTITAHHRN